MLSAPLPPLSLYYPLFICAVKLRLLFTHFFCGAINCRLFFARLFTWPSLFKYHLPMAFDPASIRKNFAGSLVAVLIVFIALVPRLSLLVSAESRLDADESIVGLMAKHISENGKIPLFFYGQHYGGGHVIEAVGAAFWRKFHDKPSSVAVQLVPLLSSLLIILISFWYLRRKFSLATASLGALFLSFSVPFIKSSLKADGYVETILLCLCSLMFYELSEQSVSKKTFNRSAFFTLLSGFFIGAALWSYDFAIFYIPVIIILSIPRVFKSALRIFLFFAGFAAGMIPAIIDNLRNNYAHLNHLVSGGPTGAASPHSLALNFLSLFKNFLPAFLSPDCVHNFTLPPPAYSWFIYASIILSFAVLALNFKKVPLPFFAVPGLIILGLCLSGYAGVSPRYLLPTEPFLTLSIPVACYFLTSSKKASRSLLAAFIVVLFSYGSISGLFPLMSDDMVVEGNMKTYPSSIPSVMSFLQKNDIDCVYTSYFIKWQLLFLSDESINAIDVQSRNTNYPSSGESSTRCPSDYPVFVFHKNSPFINSIPQVYRDQNVNFKVYPNFSDHIVVTPATK